MRWRQQKSAIKVPHCKKMLNIIFTHFQTSIFGMVSKTHGWQGYFAFNCHYANQCRKLVLQQIFFKWLPNSNFFKTLLWNIDNSWLLTYRNKNIYQKVYLQFRYWLKSVDWFFTKCFYPSVVLCEIWERKIMLIYYGSLCLGDFKDSSWVCGDQFFFSKIFYILYVLTVWSLMSFWRHACRSLVRYDSFCANEENDLWTLPWNSRFNGDE